MACPFCGERCHCSQSTRAAVLADPPDLSEEPFAARLDGAADGCDLRTSPAQSEPATSPVWRQEVASRVDAFCARRGRKRTSRIPSLSLDFERAARATAAAHYQVPDPWTEAQEERHRQPPAEPQEASNLIEFPKPAAPLPPPLPVPLIEELAEPILDKPRILEAEEPQDIGLTFGGQPLPSITLDPEPAPPELASALAAPLPHRMVAGALDAVVLTAAMTLFGAIFARMVHALPQNRLALLMAVGVPVLLWALYQYIFLVYGAGTLGTRLMGLELGTFDAEPVRRKLRRWRATAMIMSAAALGLGFLWALIDEQGLCWHDRITRTCARQK